jgi:hypothetical protein
MSQQVRARDSRLSLHSSIVHLSCDRFEEVCRLVLMEVTLWQITISWIQFEPWCRRNIFNFKNTCRDDFHDDYSNFCLLNKHVCFKILKRCANYEIYWCAKSQIKTSFSGKKNLLWKRSDSINFKLNLSTSLPCQKRSWNTWNERGKYSTFLCGCLFFYDLENFCNYH